MTALRSAAAACAALVVAACSIGEPIPQATTYVVELTSPPPATTPRRPETLRMGQVRVAAAFTGNALVYRMNEVQYTADPYNSFIAGAGGMLGARMADWLDRAGPFKSVSQPGSPQAAPYILEATVSELYGDFRPGRAPAAVVKVQFALIDLRGVGNKVVFERTIGRRVDLAQASPDALVRGYGQALTEILTELVAELSRGRAG
jgi:cholesterol transport system auxiliary component